MATVTVHLPGLLTSLLGSDDQLTVEAETLQGVLDALVAACPKIRVHLFDDTGAQRQHVLILFNGQNLRWFQKPAETPVPPDSTLTILQFVSGG
jgi:molybdopterin converting factor small subunit